MSRAFSTGHHPLGTDLRMAVVADADDVARLLSDLGYPCEIDEAAEVYGRLDVAFANAGIDPGVGFVGAWAGGERPRMEDGTLERRDGHWTLVRPLSSALPDTVQGVIASRIDLLGPA